MANLLKDWIQRLDNPDEIQIIKDEMEALIPFEDFEQERIEKLVMFCREFIAVNCWGYPAEIDGGNVQEVAEKCGLVESYIAPEDGADFEAGDRLYRFTDVLILD